MGAKSQNTSLKLGVDGQLAERAVRALLKHHESSSSDKASLLGNDLDVQVQFSLARIPGNPSPKPIRIEIPHPLVKVATSSPSDHNEDAMDEDDDDHLQDINACLIVKEDSKAWVQDLIARFPIELKCIKKVLGLQSLRTKHASFTQRRELLDRFDIFFADDRILPMLTRALGGKFFQKKKQPIPVQLSRKEALPFAIQNCLRSTFLYLSAGTCLTVKAGNTAMPSEKLISNIHSICSIVPTKVPRRWSNVRSISIKTTASVALPIYNKTPEELEQIMELAKKEKAVAEEVEEKTISNDKGAKKRKMAAAKSDLAKALKKQQVVEAKQAEKGQEEEIAQKPKKPAKKKRKEVIGETQEDTAVVKEALKKRNDTEAKEAEQGQDKEVAENPKKSAKKKRKELIDETQKEVAVVKPAPTPKSSKKKKKAVISSTNDGAEADAAPVKTPAKTPKSSKKEKATIDSTTDGAEAGAAPAKTPAKTPKSSKKKRRKDVDDSDDDKKEAVVQDTKTQSSKKRKVKAGGDGGTPAAASSQKAPKKAVAESATKEKANFIFAKKFSGPKKGYVFKKSKMGVGYHKDVLPVVDKALLAGVGKKAGRGSRKSMGHSMKKKKGGSSRTSY